MSWIKKMFGKLSDNDEQFEEYYDEKNDEVQHIERKKTERKNIVGPNHSRDVEARMTYQYPKGNFRFPLISDGENIERPRTNRNRRSQEKEEPAKEQKNKSRNHPSKHTKWKEEKPSVTVKTKKTPKVEKGNSRPFTPTEIPSPIYGFRGRPVKKEEQVEFELKKFLHNDEESKEVVIDHEALSAAEDSIPLEKESQEIAEAETAVEKSEKPFNHEPVEVMTNFREEHLEQHQTEDVLMVEDEVIDETTPVDEPDQKVELTEEVSQKSNERISLISELEQAPEEQHLEQEHNDSVQDEEPIQQPAYSARDEQVQEPAKAVHEIPAQEPVVQNEPPSEDNRVREESESTPPPQPPKGEEPRQRKRSHLPFNVLMLKQDKRQLDTRKARNVASKESEHQTLTQRAGEEEKKEEPVKEVNQERAAESISIQHAEEKTSQAGPVQGEEAVKSYSELSSSSKRTRDYVFPEMDYLMPPVSKQMSEEWLDSQRILLDETLHNFNVRAKVVNVTQGPSVTRFEVQPEPGVKVNKITNLSDDIKLSLAARDIRMEAPIPGKHTIGIEVPNRESRPVCISEVIASPAFQEPTSPLTAALGLDISGQPIVTDLSKMPHGLIAGATGSGKSVCINSILVSLLYKASPDELKMLLIDPKMVELAPYNRIPHLVSPVITDVKAATAALKWAVEEMERRYELFAHTGVRDIKRFNELAKRNKQYSDMLPYLVIVIDELADLMMMSPADVEEAICRIAQKARACGIHLIIATQRPSVDVITGLIKANVPTRVAFSVSSSVDSRTIIDGSGAERLLGKGDMLFLENGSSKPVRLQGTFVSDDEIDDIINHVREQREPDYLFQQDELIKKAQVTEEEDELFLEACEFVVDQGGASASALQRRFRIGYNRAARLMEMMESNGIISESRGSKPRDVLISESELETLA
ncbi:DNA translocase FtsK [uncultured Rossellomorea sp.]|uniref:DNA translocase FtsK n=1 Tax=uncultured Rossellomorea sp. TaxID=2837549 RepID=UPI00261D9BDF|nr:DNA translocase FtsK [uncultured Rossellomorea sp.]